MSVLVTLAGELSKGNRKTCGLGPQLLKLMRDGKRVEFGHGNVLHLRRQRVKA